MSTLLTPPQQRIAAGMSPLAAYLTEHTCGESCWEAREDVCRCSCGGKNHGCMRDAGGDRPQRTAKLDGVRYVLRAVGDRVYGAAKAINQAAPKRTIGTYSYYWDDTERGAPARVKRASKDQLARWPELAAYRETIGELVDMEANRMRPGHAWCEVVWPYLLWVREDIQIQQS